MVMTSCHRTNTQTMLGKESMHDSVLGDTSVIMSAPKVILPQWAERLSKIELPDNMEGDAQIDVYFKYNQIVNGYVVTAKWRPFDKTAETGMVIMNFSNPKTNKGFNYYGEVYCSYDTYQVTFSEEFKGYKNGEVHYFNYTSPDTTDHFKEINGNSPLGYYTPFQFLDIDFDGKEELLISDWNQGKAGNEYEVYKVTNYGLRKLDYIPLDRLTNLDKIDLRKKTITLVNIDGVYEDVEFYFSSKKRRNKIITLPRFHSSIAQDFDFEKYNKELSSPFVLDSIKENVKADKDYRESYIVRGNKLLKSAIARKIPVVDEFSNEWLWHPDGAFKYPKSFSHEETFVEDAPANVDVYSKGDIQLCYWPLLGMWSTFAEFPEEGVWLSPTERVKNVTYRADSKGIVSGYTQNGNIFYLKQKIMSGGEVKHSKVLVLINPPAMKDKVTTLTNEVANW